MPLAIQKHRPYAQAPFRPPQVDLQIRIKLDKCTSRVTLENMECLQRVKQALALTIGVSSALPIIPFKTPTSVYGGSVIQRGVGGDAEDARRIFVTLQLYQGS